MAKGFTIKASAPTTKKVVDEFNLEEAKEMVKGKSIVFCLPGRGCSYIFLKAFVQLCFDLVQAGASIQISQDYSSMVNFARCKVLGANVLRGPRQQPWDGKLEYDYQLWIDNDIVFDTEKFYRLVAMDKILELYKENEHGTELVKDIEKVLNLQVREDEYTPSPRTKEYLKQCINLIKGV